eukprot:gnl/TRDRNA2_/TRDRNA2_151497_c0_seq1.p1 gnl/TRDRNA2_/TRDRNA2_151497_c0~~gnl/TRDRNA2_/TRDRNA2_151497_c0_seq1.p1  ORF type:complete len:473 (-),score=64.76 gnl/TRDRNA2_/TRDRNA2_151497_c0_seq1:108-1526(-)
MTQVYAPPSPRTEAVGPEKAPMTAVPVLPWGSAPWGDASTRGVGLHAAGWPHGCWTVEGWCVPPAAWPSADGLTDGAPSGVGESRGGRYRAAAADLAHFGAEIARVLLALQVGLAADEKEISSARAACALEREALARTRGSTETGTAEETEEHPRTEAKDEKPRECRVLDLNDLLQSGTSPSPRGKPERRGNHSRRGRRHPEEEMATAADSGATKEAIADREPPKEQPEEVEEDGGWPWMTPGFADSLAGEGMALPGMVGGATFFAHEASSPKAAHSEASSPKSGRVREASSPNAGRSEVKLPASSSQEWPVLVPTSPPRIRMWGPSTAPEPTEPKQELCAMDEEADVFAPEDSVLSALLGCWCDHGGTVYEVVACCGSKREGCVADGRFRSPRGRKSCIVRARRPDGTAHARESAICIVDEGCVTWSDSYVLDIESMTPMSMRWTAVAAFGKDVLWLRRCEAEADSSRPED